MASSPHHSALQNRRKKLEKELGEGAILLLGAGPEKIRNHDVSYPFRALSNFQYLAGFEEPAAILVVDLRDKPRWILYLEERDEHMAVWMGERPSLDDMAKHHHFHEARPLDQFKNDLGKLFSGADRVYTVIGEEEARDGDLIKTWAAVRNGSRRGVKAPFALIDAYELLGAMRLIKDKWEVDMLRLAAAATAKGHARAREVAKPGMSEAEVQAAMECAFKEGGGKRLGYESIVASGPNACVLHYVENQRKIKKGDLLLIDAGTEVGGYTADITRTAPVGADPSPEQKTILEIVLNAQLAAIEVSQPGASLGVVHDAAVKELTKGLIRIGAIEGPLKRAVKEGAYVPFYPHGTSHWLGLDVHDPCPYRDGNGQPIQLSPGMVFTIEPGLYFRGEAAKKAPKFGGIGVRTEDDILVTKSGNEVLTSMVPKDI